MVVVRERRVVTYHALFPLKRSLAIGLIAENLDLPQIRFVDGTAYGVCGKVRPFDEGSLLVENDRVILLAAQRLGTMIHGTSVPA